MRYVAKLLSTLFCSLLVIGCGSASRQDGPALPVRSFSMQVLPESFGVQGSGRFRLEQRQDGERMLLEIHASLAESLSHFYAGIHYDPLAWQPVGAHDAGLLGDGSLSLLAGGGGSLQYGLLQPGSHPEGYSGSGLLATIEFAPGRESPSGRQVSMTVPPVEGISRNARWNAISWDYLNPGDYDQNGVVSISDLTPLGQNFKATGPFDYDSSLWMVDGDGNGEINLADISVIGQHFGNMVSGYDLYASPDGSGHPDIASARYVASIPFSAAQGSAGERRHFQYTDLDVLYRDRYWVVEKVDRAASGLTQPWNGSWHVQMMHGQSVPLSYFPAELKYINGLPMFVFDTQGAGGDVVMFCRAEDPLGDNWLLPFTVSGSAGDCTKPHLAAIDGRPAVVFGDGDDKKTWFRIADDEIGDSWGPMVKVDESGFFAGQLYEAAGRAVVLSLSTNQIYGWVSDSDFGSFAYPSLLENDADITTGLQGPSGLYQLFQDSAGSSWFRSYTVQAGNFVGGSPNRVSADPQLEPWELLRGSDGRLQAMFSRQADDKIFHATALDSSALNWTLPTIISQFSMPAPACCQAYGRLYNCQYLNNMQTPLLSPASGSGEWEVLGPVSNLEQPPNNPSMANVRGHPAIVFTTYDSGDYFLYYGIWY